ncbi:hypothetical protein C8J57DRAFT_1518886 [Mycena rebaudengoi]|nr:hypothetical protein C8J57DRAFT_1518886 [Mycena rebaudengoi]
MIAVAKNTRAGITENLYFNSNMDHPRPPPLLNYLCPNMSYQQNRYADSETHIQNRDDLGRFFDRRIYGGTWNGPDRNPTWVPELGVPFDAPWPQFVPSRLRTRSMQRDHRAGNNRPWDSANEPAHYASNNGPHGGPAPHHFGGGSNGSPTAWTNKNQYSDSRSGSSHSSRASSSSRNRSRSPPRRPAQAGYRGRGVTPGMMRFNDTRYDGRDEELRHNALASRGRGAIRGGRGGAQGARSQPWTRTVFPPEIREAALTAAGHPMFPSATAQGDVSDYGSDDGGLDANWLAEENFRIASAVAKIGPGAAYLTEAPLIPSSVYGWGNKAIVTKAEALNVLHWLSFGSAEAHEIVHHYLVAFGDHRQARRTEGQLVLLKRQGGANREYWLITTGRPSAPKSNTVSRAAHVPSTVAPAAPQDELMPEATAQRHAFVGTSTIGEDSTTLFIAEAVTPNARVQSGTHTSYADAVKMYDAMATREWPLGMRAANGAYPVTERASPWPDDVVAWYTINALAPRRLRPGPSFERSKFFELLMRILSVPGMFFRIAQLGELQFGRLPLEHYPFGTANITWAHPVSWLLQHGIDRTGSDIAVLESYARARRNKRDGHVLSNVVFTKGLGPFSVDDISKLADTEVTKWDALTHAPLREGVTSEYPCAPGTIPMES